LHPRKAAKGNAPVVPAKVTEEIAVIGATAVIGADDVTAETEAVDETRAVSKPKRSG
jgi:hypothetical protein